MVQRLQFQMMVRTNHVHCYYLQSAGLVKLKNDFDFVKGTSKDIVENNKALVIKPIQMATAVLS